MSHRPRFLPSGLLFVSSLLVLNPARGQGQAQPRVVEAVDNARRVTLLGNVHPLARAEFDHGAASDALPMTRTLLLLKRSDEQEAALQGYLEKQQDKDSPNYHQWLTPVEFGAQYGPADADVQSVTQWLTGQGFTVEKVYSGKTVIEFSGTAAQVRAAFGTEIRQYQVEGKAYTANASDPQIPAALAPVVAGVVSLNSFPRQSHVRVTGIARKVGGKPELEPLFTFPNPFGGNGNFYALAPGDFATIYNSKGLISAGNDGTGQTIAIVAETNINVSDVQAFRTLFGLPATFTSASVILNGEDPGITSVHEEGEADLDTQWSGAVAPGATVELVVSASTPASQGVDLSALYIIEQNLAGVMSESYGNCEAHLGSAGNAFFNSLWEQAAAQGITAIVSSGDGGSAGCDNFNKATPATHGLAVSGLASTPYNISVGGTDFDEVNKWSTYWSATNNSTTGASALSYIPEIPWSENCAQIGLTGCGASAPNGSLNIVAGSGGPSSNYSKPNWQLGVTGMPNDNHRDLPDVSLFASPGFDGSGYIVCQADAYANLPCSLTTPGGVNVQIVGGTSAAAPAFAGVMALVNQYQAAHGGTGRQGNANYVLYQLAKKSGASCVSSTTEGPGCIFNDVTKGNSYIATRYGSSVGTNSVPCQGGTPNCSVTVAGSNGVLVEPISSTTEAWTVTAGYDMATGLGSVNVNNLATNWRTVSTVPTTTTLTLSPTTGISHGTTETVNVSVKPTSGVAAGDVSLIASFVDGTSQGVDGFTLSNGLITNGTTQRLPGGTYNVAAHYAGDGTNAPSDSSAVSVTVTPETSQAFANLASLDINGNPVSFTASNVTYGSGYAIFRVDIGDANASVSPSTGISSNCSKGVSSCPTGKLTLASTGAPLGTSSLLLNILGYAETQVLPPGSYAVTASYPGDASYNPSQGSTSFTIAKAPVTVTAGTATPVQLGNFDQIIATVLTTSDGVGPSGTCQFLVDGTPMGSPIPIYEAGGYTPAGNPPNYAWANASTGTSFTSIGNHTLSAQYSGDGNYAAATSAPYAVTVTQALPFFEAWATPNTINLNQQTTLTAQVGGTVANLPPTGTVTFSDGTATLSGTITYTTAGGTLNATMPYTPTTVGNHSIGASYAGDSNYLSASSGPAILSVTGPDFTITASGTTAMTVTAGKTATFTNAVSVAGINGFSSAVTLSCTLPAAATTCSAMPASLTSGSGTATIAVTTTAHQFVVPSGRPTDFGPTPSMNPFLTLAVFALIGAGLAVRLKRERQIVFVPLAVLLLVGLSLVAACGGGSSGSSGPPTTFGTQAGTYTITISATAPGLAHTTTLSLTVN